MSEEIKPGSGADEDEFPLHDDEENDSPSPDAGSVQSVAERLKDRRKKIGSDKFEYMDLPGYDGEFVAKFKRMQWEALANIADNAAGGGNRSKRKVLNGHADVIATACEELMIRRIQPGGEEELVPMNEFFHDVFGDKPVRFDPRLSNFLEIEIDGTPTARKVVFAVFNNDLAVTALHNDLGEWMQSSKGEEDQAF
jgi:hypothetical protein